MPFVAEHSRRDVVRESVRRVGGAVVSVLILVGVVFFVLGVIDGIVWILSSGVSNPSTNPTYLLDQRKVDKLAGQAVVWIPAGILLVLGGVSLWSYVSRGEGERVPPPPPGRAVRVAPVALGAGLVFLLVSATVASVPLPQRAIVFADSDFPFTLTDPGGTIRASDPFSARAGEILTGTFRAFYTDVATGNDIGPVVLNSSAYRVPGTGPMLLVMPTSVSWEYPVAQDGNFVAVVGGDLGVCPPYLDCPANYTSHVSGHVTATGPPPYPVEGSLLLIPGVALTMPPILYGWVRNRRKVGGARS